MPSAPEKTTNVIQIQCVQQLQNFAPKVALAGAPWSEHVTPYLKDLGWLKITEKHTFEIRVTMYSHLYNDLPK